MRVKIINKHGHVWEFSSMAKARPHITPKFRGNYRETRENGKVVRVYDDRDQD